PQLLTAITPKNLSSNVTTTCTIMTTDVTRMQTSTVLDLESITKAAQALTGEIILSKLLEKMMAVVIENAGAERGFLLLPQADKWFIEAEGAIDKQEATVLCSLPVEKYLPEAIISYVAHTKENVRLDNASQDGLYTENPYIQTHQTQSVLCFPIIYQQQLRAILYFENNLTTGAFTPERLKVLTMLSSQIAISLENAQVMANLDSKVKARTSQLNTKVEELTQTRHELVQSEKMASLGRLVAGFAHELNTPLGVAVGSASALQQEAKKVNHLMAQEEIDIDELLSAIDTIDKGFDLTLSNLDRAANLVTSFKRTAVDQSSDEERVFLVKEVIDDIINTLYNRFKQTDVSIKVDCPNDIKIKSLPGALEQILTNFLMNSLIHGFNDGQEAGNINIAVQLTGTNLHIEYADDGKGIDSENLEKIFEPFFTTHRAHGGSGLGMYICYNIITTQLHGTLTCESTVGNGVVFKVDILVTLV
ncbi:MAG: GAF domain-containing sensor histidine kinase, partial [Thiomargarita sp.]|nr:GAF domain-containing sensor histidine kinase [Thiomargarita sp.]